jgi:hypothetical protein
MILIISENNDYTTNLIISWLAYYRSDYTVTLPKTRTYY